MNLNHAVERVSAFRTWMAKALFALFTIALIWQSPLPLHTTAMATPIPLLATNAANQVQGAADEIRDRSKNLIRGTKKNVEKTAHRNAAKVDQADDNGSFVERKAQRDRNQIEQRAEEDAARTERAVDDSMNAVKGAMENIKDAFRG